MGQAKLQIDEVVQAGDWAAILPPQTIRDTAAAIHRETEATGEIALALADDSLLRKLNSGFRGKDRPTNVLSFPTGNDDFLGDVAISCETLLREAHEQDKAPKDHAVHLLVHGILHLLGYDHQSEDAADAMESLERRVLERLGIADPYENESPAH